MGESTICPTATHPVSQNGPAHANIFINTFISYQFSLIFGRSSNYFYIKILNDIINYYIFEEFNMWPLKAGNPN
jgi:hypothetical protein